MIPPPRRRRAPLPGLLLLGTAAAAATIDERRIDVAVEGDAVVTREQVRVTLEEADDLDAWRRYLVFMDSHAEILEVEASVLDAGGRTVATVPRRLHERVESPGYDLYSSEWIHVVPFPPLVVGQRLAIAVTIRERPYYPSAAFVLAQGSRQRKVAVTVRAPGKTLRHRLNDPTGAFVLREVEGGIEVAGTDVPPPSAALAPEITEAPLLRVAWDGGATWQAIGAWYQDLIRPAQDASPEAAARSAGIVAGRRSPRERVLALTEFVRAKVRYEAVEIGVGGWVPHGASATLSRGFGDCKDKSELLRQMLAAAAIPAHLVLLHAGAERAVDAAFPTPDQFNHCIVAIPADRAGAEPGDAVVDGMLLLDPTVERGGVSWLPPMDRGGAALLIDGAHSRLLTVGADAGVERRQLVIEGTVDGRGQLSADVRLDLSGKEAAAWLERAAREPAPAVEAAIGQLFAQVLPAASLDEVAWRVVPGEVPRVTLTARAREPEALRGEPPARWLPTLVLTAFPSPRLLEGRTLPVLLSAGTSHTTWRLRVQGCVPEPVEELAESGAGRLRHRVSLGPAGEVVVEREAVIASARVEAADLAGLAKLCAAEARAGKRRTTLSCGR